MSIRYNTAVFSTISANNYYIILVVQDFLGSLSNYNVYNNGSAELADSSVLNTSHEAAVNDRLVNYTSTDYMTAYGVNFVSKVRNVLLVTSDTNTFNNSVLNSTRVYSEYGNPYF